MPLRVEAGAFAGKPVYFAMLGPWNPPPGEAEDRTVGQTVVVSMILSLFVTVTVLGGIMAFRNLRAARGDRRSARRLAGYVFAIVMGTWLFTADHILAFDEWGLLSTAFGFATGWAVMAWILYMAIEPYARRHWPHAMISWTRLLSGRYRDPLVGRDILFGCLSALLLMLALMIPSFAARVSGTPLPQAEFHSDPELFRGGRYVLGAIFFAQTDVMMYLGIFVLILVMRIVLRKAWLATAIFALFVMTVVSDVFTDEPIELVADALAVVVFVTCIVRFGLLSTLVLAFYITLLWSFPTTFDFSAWYAGTGLVGILIALALPAYGFWISLAGQPIFRDQLAEA
jgi:hypothetical protein